MTTRTGCWKSGSHEQLIAKQGYYAELERVQREGAEEDDLERLRLNIQ